MLDRARRLLRTMPFFWILVPIFFLLKNLEEYMDFIPGREIMQLLAIYIPCSCILYFILYRIFVKQPYKAALCCFLLLAVYFFYSDFDHLLQHQKWLFPWTRYRWSLPALGLLIGWLLFSISRSKKKPEKTIYFLNLLLILFCLSGVISLTYRWLNPPRPILSLENDSPLSYRAPLTGKRPDIYFLLFDEYQGNTGLQKIFHYDNLGLKKDLSEKGFFLPAMSRSNYKYTFFSMPSILNMGYLLGEIQGPGREDLTRHFSSAIKLMRNARLVKCLEGFGYAVVNLSPFAIDASGKRVAKYQTILAGKELIRHQTLFNVLIEKFSTLITNPTLLYYLNPSDHNFSFYNKYIQEQLSGQLKDSASRPKFIYAHLFMPHFPTLYDSSGRSESFTRFIEAMHTNDTKYLDEHYLSYLKYTNTVLTGLVDTIIKQDPGSIIMIMSDHGYREDPAVELPLQYNNQFCIRTPGRDYSGWPDTVDAVNAFRLMLNKEFDQQLGYLPYQARQFEVPKK
jgi:hypothetical protein